MKITYYLYLLLALTLSGCIAESDDLKDTDKDGIADSIDCAPENASQWRTIKYSSIDNDLDGKFVNKSGQLCSGKQLPAKYSVSEASTSESDCDDENNQLWSLKTYNSIDNDLDGKFILTSGAVCSGDKLASKYQLPPVDKSQLDCNDNDKKTWRLISAYRDNDRDSYGSGDKATYCIGNDLPKNLSTTATDCNDNNAALFSLIGYQAIDSDLDGYQIRSSGAECTNGTLPNIYKLNFNNKTPDCDDSNNQKWKTMELYKDKDSDSFGTGNKATYCIGNALPKNLSTTATDCNDNDADLFSELNYQAIDSDLDSFQIRSSGTECTNGTLSSIYKPTFNDKAPDCDDSNNQKWKAVELYKDNDNDSFGAGEKVEHCIGESNPALWVNVNGDCADDNNLIWRNVNVYADTDNDSYGDKNNSNFSCIGDQAPQGHVLNFTDCDDSNKDIWRTDQAYFDIDGDGIGAGQKRAHCTNAQPAPNTSTLNYDCDDNNADVFRKITIYRDTDGDGIGAGNGILTCMGNSYLEGNVSIYGYDPEPSNAAISNFDLSPAILATP